MKRHLPLLLSAVLVTAILSCQKKYSNDSATDASITEPVARWMADHAIHFKTVETGHGFRDMEPLKEVIGDARIVLLGEPTHGNREVFQMKHRLVEFLVREMGFNTIVLEAPLAETFDVNEYVLHGKGNASGALAAIRVWPWDTREQLELIEWIRAYNTDPTKQSKVSFYGFDMQQVERVARVTLEYLDEVDPDFSQKARNKLGRLIVTYSDADAWGYRPFIAEDSNRDIQNQVAEVVGKFKTRKEAWEGITGTADYEFAFKHAQLLQSWVYANAERGNTYNNIRDSTMAQNIRWILEREGPGSKIVAWAHNIHVANVEAERRENRTKMAGYHLRRMYGDQMVDIGFFCNRGQFTAFEEAIPSRGILPFDMGPAKEGTLEAVCADAELQLALVDLRELPDDGLVKKWFDEKIPTQSNWGGYDANDDEWSHEYYHLPEAFDAILYIDSTSPTQAVDPSNYLIYTPIESPSNLGFENKTEDGTPDDWIIWTKLKRYGFRIETSDVNPYEGQLSAMVHRDAKDEIGEATGNIQQMIDATPFRGKRIRFRAAARAEPDEGSRAFLRLHMVVSEDGDVHDEAMPLFDSLDEYRVESDTWKTYEIIADVPEDAHSISYGIFLSGNGSAWMDAVEVSSER